MIMQKQSNQISLIVLALAAAVFQLCKPRVKKAPTCNVALIQADTSFARISNCDLRDFLEAGEQGAIALQKLTWKHGVLVFPKQHGLTPAQEVAVNKMLGCHAETADVGSGWSSTATKKVLALLPSQPEILCQGNADLKNHYGVTMQLFQKLTYNNEGFHSDGVHNWQTGLPAITSMYCVEAPDAGGETFFADTRLAFDRASPDIRQLARRLQVHYIYDESLGLPIMRDGIVRVGRENSSNWNNASGAVRVVHPLVRQHPETGEEAIYISSANIDYIEGAATRDDKAIYFDTAAAYELVEALIGNVTKAPLVYAHVWREGDFVMWDNRLTAHAPAEPAEMNGTRLHHRVRLTGSSQANRDMLGSSLSTHFQLHGAHNF